jgi:predicted transcriptional regulator
MPKEKQKIEITRAFSYKLNVGNYESRDFFCSEKSEVETTDLNDVQLERTSLLLAEFCKNEVIKSVNDYLNESKPKPVKTTKQGQEAIDKFKEIIKDNPTSMEKAERDRIEIFNDADKNKIEE